jgi:hypothetical protein
MESVFVTTAILVRDELLYHRHVFEELTLAIVDATVAVEAVLKELLAWI